MYMFNFCVIVDYGLQRSMPQNGIVDIILHILYILIETYERTSKNMCLLLLVYIIIIKKRNINKFTCLCRLKRTYWEYYHEFLIKLNRYQWHDSNQNINFYLCYSNQLMLFSSAFFFSCIEFDKPFFDYFAFIYIVIFFNGFNLK